MIVDLPRARRAAERDRLAGRDGERVALAHEVVECRRVREDDVLHLDRAPSDLRQRVPSVEVVDERHAVEEGEEGGRPPSWPHSLRRRARGAFIMGIIMPIIMHTSAA